LSETIAKKAIASRLFHEGLSETIAKKAIASRLEHFFVLYIAIMLLKLPKHFYIDADWGVRCPVNIHID
ncbi:MAG: hypothetical protein DRR19_25740, partial [Candidatus Parabeggiatoa sp. nov. 1]